MFWHVAHTLKHIQKQIKWVISLSVHSVKRCHRSETFSCCWLWRLCFHHIDFSLKGQFCWITVERFKNVVKPASGYTVTGRTAKILYILNTYRIFKVKMESGFLNKGPDKRTDHHPPVHIVKVTEKYNQCLCRRYPRIRSDLCCSWVSCHTGTSGPIPWGWHRVAGTPEATDSSEPPGWTHPAWSDLQHRQEKRHENNPSWWQMTTCCFCLVSRRRTVTVHVDLLKDAITRLLRGDVYCSRSTGFRAFL